MHTSGVFLITLHVPIWKRLVPNDNNWIYTPIESPWSEEHLVHQGEQMYKHIAYELRYENLSSIEYGSIYMKAHYFI